MEGVSHERATATGDQCPEGGLLYAIADVLERPSRMVLKIGALILGGAISPVILVVYVDC